MASTVKPDNQGEGNRDSAKRYNERVQEHVRSGRSDQAAEDARHDVEGDDAEALREAEREGKKHIAEEDPEVEALPDDDDRKAGP
jgi:hypothetical protein